MTQVSPKSALLKLTSNADIVIFRKHPADVIDKEFYLLLQHGYSAADVARIFNAVLEQQQNKREWKQTAADVDKRAKYYRPTFETYAEPTAEQLEILKAGYSALTDEQLVDLYQSRL